MITPSDYLCQQLVSSNRQRLVQDYGFFADSALTTTQNVKKIKKENPDWFKTALPTNLAYHNLCTYLTLTPCLEILLGLGENFCLEW